MIRTVLKSKICAHVTEINLNYGGSITIDESLMKTGNIIPFEKVDVLNVNNGARFSTYAIEGDKGVICINGAAARLAATGDKIIILSYCQTEGNEIVKPVIINERSC